MGNICFFGCVSNRVTTNEIKPFKYDIEQNFDIEIFNPEKLGNGVSSETFKISMDNLNLTCKKIKKKYKTDFQNEIKVLREMQEQSYFPTFHNAIEDKDFYDEKTAEIKDQDGNLHEIQIRWSRQPSLFYVKNDSDIKDVEEAVLKGKITRGPDKKGHRWRVAQKNHGIVFRRLGRRMDVVRNFGKYMTVGPNSRYWKCEINFPPALDEHFSVNTSKQQIIPNQRFLETLDGTDIFGFLNKIEKKYSEENQILKAKLEKGQHNK
mgnify:CR=1 FL=1